MSASEEFIRTEFAKLGRGLHALLEGIGNQTEILTSIHEALSKEPPPSKMPEALAELTARIDGLAAEVLALREAIERPINCDYRASTLETGRLP
jgi:hypothetical protein